MNRTNGPPSSKTSSTPQGSSTLRPRTRRLISIDDELSAAADRESGASPFGSRTASPNASSHSSRPKASKASSSFNLSFGAQAPKVIREPSAALSGLFGNWVQDVTSNVFGSGGSGSTTPETATRQRKPQWAAHQRTGSSAPPKQWGPSASSSLHIGEGPQEERESLVRAMKRKDLLTANEHLVPDSFGRIKRRNSDDRTSSSAPPGEGEDRDALVYIHNVQPQDTLAGITIKFNCQPEVLRKANRMWPNDSIQTKTTIVLPVDACGVKGRPVAAPKDQQEDLLLGEYASSSNMGSDSVLPNGSASQKSQTTENHLTPSTSHSKADTEHPWKHDSWVLLPNNTQPTEIGRMPRRTLGFFPPARRKSMAFSDATSPTPSLDLPRSSTSTNNVHSSPNQAMRPGRSSRTNSTASRPPGRHRSTSNSFHLHGPGGVGTMGKNVKSPGPAQDPLNKFLDPYLPNVAPPPDQEYFTPWAPSLLDVDAGTSFQHGGSGALTPSGGEIDLQKIGGAIEGWVRKVGSQASQYLKEHPSTPGRARQTAEPVIGAVGRDTGLDDLIELQDDAFEIEEGEHEARGRVRRDESSILTSRPEQFQSARPDFKLNLAMRDRRRGGGSSKTD